MKRYKVEFYEDEHGNCPIADWLRELDRNRCKDNQIMLKKIYYQIERLEHEGLSIGEPIVKRVDSQIWELRPLPNRIFFGSLRGNRFILLHQFRKNTNKTPRQEIDQAKREYRSWQERGKGQ